MKKGVIRIISGSLLLALQILSAIGNISSGNFYSLSPPVSSAQLAADIIFLASANLFGILGTILLISGLRAYFKDNKADSSERQTVSAMNEESSQEANSRIHQPEEPRDSVKDALAQVLAAGVVEGAKAVEANADAQFLNQNDPEYGLVPEKPVYCRYVDGSEDYLDSLRTENGEKLVWNRRGSRAVDGIEGLVDIYDSTLPNGQAYRTVYVNMYAHSNSTTAPAGFVFYHPEKKAATPAPAPSKPKTRFCKLCGNPIDPVTRKCTGCKKQYFRPPVFTGKHYFIAATAIACAAVLFLLFALAAKNNHVAELTTRVSELEGELAVKDGTIQEYERSDTNLRIVISVHGSTIERLQKENDDMRAEIRFYENHVVLVPDDGSNEYHTYGCVWRKYYETTYKKTYRIFTTEAAKSKGYKPCSSCCD